MITAPLYMADFKLIANGNDKISPEFIYNEHKQSLDYIDMCLSNCTGKAVVITHHSPSILSVNEKYEGEESNAFYYSSLEEFIEKHRPVLWTHGHMHDNIKYDLFGTKVVCNPRGYIGDLNPTFDPLKVVVI